jgi:nicotinate-nucleotide pyrophosphorylase (carboxylating)
MNAPSIQCIQDAVRRALAEDLAFDDVTTTTLFSQPRPARASIIARHSMIVAGIAVAREVFLSVDPSLKILKALPDGHTTSTEDSVLVVEGDGRSLLMAERVALNFMQRLSGIATLARRFCEAVRGYPTRILDTRKTTPGLRALEKWAVRLGGGHNHRFSLNDGLLIKDNHLALLHAERVGLAQACRQVRAAGPHGLKVIVEVQRLGEVKEALSGEADVILLDNMTPSQVRQAVGRIKGRALVEVSGGITLLNAKDMAMAGANFLSIGALTHSAPAADLSLDLRAISAKRGRS